MGQELSITMFENVKKVYQIIVPIFVVEDG
jgi:hypothetical protein